MPRIVPSGVEALKSIPMPSSDLVVEALGVGSSREEVAALLGLPFTHFSRMLEEDPDLRARVEAAEAGRKFELRQHIHNIATDPDSPHQGRVLVEIYREELTEKEDKEAESAQAWTFKGLVDRARNQLAKDKDSNG